MMISAATPRCALCCLFLVWTANGQVSRDLLGRSGLFPCTNTTRGCIPKIDKILEDLMKDYDKAIRPGAYLQPTAVRMDFKFLALLDINELDMEIKLSISLKLNWIDERLKVKKDRYPRFFVFPTRTLVDAAQEENIWTPRLTVLNEKGSVDVSDMFDKGSFFWNPSDGQLTLNKYGIILIPCSISLQNFPMDAQICSVLVGSNVYGTEDIELSGSLDKDVHKDLLSFVKNMQLSGLGSFLIKRTTNNAPGGKQTFHRYDLLMSRHVGYYLIGTYFPGALVVIISWLTFWMPRESSTERMALGVTCVLTITTLLVSSQSSSPRVSYVKAIDIYMGVCFGLVFTTLLQSTVIGHWLRKGRIWNDMESKVPNDTKGTRGSDCNPELALIVKRVMTGGIELQYKANILKKAKMSDAWSRVLFPVLFSVFNVVYWVYYKIVFDVELSFPTLSDGEEIKGGSYTSSWF